MKHSLLTFALIVLLLAISVASVFAEETPSYLDLIEQIKTDQAEYEENYKLIQAKLEMAYDMSDAEKYIEAKSELRALVKPAITKEQSDLIEAGIKASADYSSAQWLFANSQYYKPVLTLTYNKDGFSYRSNTIVVPGSEISLPVLTAPGKNLQFKGWGLTETQVTYPAGTKIQMPYTSTTLFAVFGTKDGLETGKNLAVSDYSVEDVKVNTEESETIEIPRRKIFDFKFNVSNNGTEDISQLEVTFDSEDPLLVVLTETLSAKVLESGDSKTATFQVITKAPVGTEMSGTITLKDKDNQVWTYDKTFKVK